MIIFIGLEIRGSWIAEIAEHYKMGFRVIPERPKIAEHVNLILDVSQVKYMVFDIEQYIDSGSEIAEQISRIATVNNAKPIIFAPGYSPVADVIVCLLQRKMKNFILSVTLADQKEDLKKCINGYFDQHSIEEFGYVEPILAEDEAKADLNFRNIGVVGANARMGTTTAAVQLVKYLALKGHKACIIEMNGHHWSEELAEWYETQKDEELGRITYMSVDIFHDLTKLQQILRMGYEYYIYDYGVMTDPDFNKISFLERDYQVFVCGSGPSELRSTFQVIENSFYDDVFYLFSLVPEGDRSSITEMMEQKADKTFFMEFAPDPFTLSQGNAVSFGRMLPVEDLTPPEKPKKGFFTRWRKS